MKLLNRILFGEYEPNVGRRTVIIALLVLLAIAAYGYANDFAPSPGWALLGFWLSMLVGGCLAGLFIFVYATGRVPFYTEPSTGMKVLIYVMFSLLLVGLSWITVVHSFGAVTTAIFGTSVTIEVDARKPSRLSKRERRSCRYQIHAAELESAFPGYLCANEWRYIQYPEHFKLVMHGKQSIFGFNVQSFEVKSD